jgi:hypothetical protein
MTNQQQTWFAQMQGLLVGNVPRFIKHIKDRGGVSNEEFRWLQCEEESPDYPSEVILRADEYLLYPKNKKIFMHGLFVLTLALAIMSFFPGGVRFFGLHFSSEIEDFVVVEDETKA